MVVAIKSRTGTISCQLRINAISAVTIIEIYRRYLVKDEDDRHYLAMARWIAAVTGIAMIEGAI